ncbi:MAG: HPP family protein [Sphingomonas sp.]
MLSILVGVTALHLFGSNALAAGLSVGTAIMLMSALGCLHPPGGACALLPVIGGAGGGLGALRLRAVSDRAQFGRARADRPGLPPLLGPFLSAPPGRHARHRAQFPARGHRCRAGRAGRGVRRRARRSRCLARGGRAPRARAPDLAKPAPTLARPGSPRAPGPPPRGSARNRYRRRRDKGCSPPAPRDRALARTARRAWGCRASRTSSPHSPKVLPRLRSRMARLGAVVDLVHHRREHQPAPPAERDREMDCARARP